MSVVMAIAAGWYHTVVLAVPTAPTITRRPTNKTVKFGENVSFTVTATGFPLYYQWRKDGANIPGATDATYSLGPAQMNQAGSYTVIVSSPTGSVTSWPPAVLTVTPPILSGVVVAWGANNYGQTMVPAAAQSGVSAIAAGANHSLALKKDGTVVAWGRYDYGQITVPAAAQSGVKAIAAGYGHSVALKNDGSVVTWGRNTNGQTTVPVAARSGVIAIAAGGHHYLGDFTMALKDDGSVVVWGWDSFGLTYPLLATRSGVTAIAAGVDWATALKNDGSVVAWGGYTTQTTVPTEGQSGVSAIAAGAYHTLALKNDGRVVAWGADAWGETNAPIAARSGVTAVAAGGGHTLALLSTEPVLNARRSGDNFILSWPTNAIGFTLQSTTNLDSPVIWVDSIRLPTAIGGRFTVTNAISGNGRVYRLNKP